MSIDIWTEPLAEPSINAANGGSGETPSHARASLFLSDSEDEREDRPHVSADMGSPKAKDGLARPDQSKLDALFAGLDEDDDLFTVEPALDVEMMKRQAAVRMHATSAADKNLVPSLSLNDTGQKSNRVQDDDKDAKGKKAKRAVPKLDEERLLGTDGFPRLIKDSKNFKVTGKGHETADLEKLFRLYHGWTHRMFPKFQFKDTVDRVEKLCRSRRLAVNMKAWKDEANGILPEVRHEIAQDDVEEDGGAGEDDGASGHGQVAPPSSRSSSRPSTPVTRPGSVASTAPSAAASEPENDGMDIDIDALLREEEEMMREMNCTDKEVPSYKPSNNSDGDSALWTATGSVSEATGGATDFQGNRTSSAPRLPDEMDDEELWDIAAEMEAESLARSRDIDAAESTSAPDGSVHLPVEPFIAPTAQPSVGGDWDDMYA